VQIRPEPLPVPVQDQALAGFIEDKFRSSTTYGKTSRRAGGARHAHHRIGKDGETFNENYHFAALSIEMALSRA
jgi:FAD/FMN-containing dehydrogenase